MTDDRAFESVSLARHMIRGVVGFGALVASIGLVPVYGYLSLDPRAGRATCPAWLPDVLDRRADRNAFDGAAEARVRGRGLRPDVRRCRPHRARRQAAFLLTPSLSTNCRTLDAIWGVATATVCRAQVSSVACRSRESARSDRDVNR